MLRSMRYSKIAKEMIRELTEEVVNLLTRHKYPDLYYNLETRISDELTKAFEEGRQVGLNESATALTKFDGEKDKLES